MAKAKPTSITRHATPASRYNLRVRPARVTKPPRKTKRVYRTSKGLVSLRKTPEEFVSIVKSNSVQSPLLRLPAELRHEIFKYALGGTRIQHLQRLGSNRGDWRWRTRFWKYDVARFDPYSFALLRVCRQIYHETATLAYSEKDFEFIGIDALEHFLGPCKQAQIEAIETVMLCPIFGLHRGGLDDALRIREALRGLKNCKGLWDLYLRRPLGNSVRFTSAFAEAAMDTVAEGLAGPVKVYSMSSV